MNALRLSYSLMYILSELIGVRSPALFLHEKARFRGAKKLVL